MAIFKSFDKSIAEDRQMLQILMSYPKYKKLLEFFGTTDRKQDVIDQALDSIADNAGEILHALRRRKRYV
jgi:hypothetical protein